MKNLLFFLFPLLFFSCSSEEFTFNTGIIPEPVEMSLQKSYFQFDKNLSIVFNKEDENLKSLAEIFAVDIKKTTNIDLSITKKTRKKISLLLLSESDLSPEAYEISISPNNIKISAKDYHGLHNGLQSIKQLIMLNYKHEKSTIPCLHISDFPRFSYRGMHLDVCRHFIPLDDVKKYIDYLSIYKFNTFHWHLTDDQGWRIEIKQYPKLTEIGGWRSETMLGHSKDQPRTYDGIKHGGFYTQEEAKELIEYAAQRYITIIPEIELPGHAQAAIASYPWLGVTGEKIEVMKEWGISQNIYSPSEKTFEFLENVLSEIVELFPSEYIHIGGDEAIKNQWKSSKDVQSLIKSLGLKNEHDLQSWFIQRIEKFLNSKGKIIIGWDEILEGGLAPNATVMSWRGTEGGIAAAKLKHNVIMSPNTHCYFDYYQTKSEKEPLAIGGYLPLEKVYNFEPVPSELTSEEQKYILGAQANVWTEYIPDFSYVEYMIFPRILAISEVNWTQKDMKDLEKFKLKTHYQEKLLMLLGVNYSKSGMPK